MFTFAHYRVGEIYGPHHLSVEPDLLARWDALFPQMTGKGGQVPPGLLSVITMLAYTHIITPRPPGNIHAAQGFDIARLPRIGETLTTCVRCDDKQVRKDRGWVYLRFETQDEEAQPVFAGRFVSIVAQ